MEAFALALLVSTIKKIVDFVRYAAARDVSSVVTQIVAWAAGIGAAFLAASSDILGHVAVGGYILGQANGASLVIIGLSLASGGGIFTDIIKGIDNNQTAAVPPLINQ